MSPATLVSVPELLRSILAEALYDVADVVVGPAAHTQQQSGVVVIAEQGTAQAELYLPLLHQRFALRCLAPSVDMAESIARAVLSFVSQFGRRAVALPSTGEQYVVHSITLASGPTLARDSEVTWEELIYINVMVGTEAVP